MTAITIMAMVVWDWIQHGHPFLLLHCLDFRVRTMYIVVTCLLPAKKTIIIAFTFDLLSLAFFTLSEVGVFQCIDCLFVS
jgi:hypothetical protein